jgi:hypothetical protein
MEKVGGILDGYCEQAAWAADARIAERTVARYRSQPDGLPFVEFGGKIYIPIEESREWLRSRIKRPNQRRRAI